MEGNLITIAVCDDNLAFAEELTGQILSFAERRHVRVSVEQYSGAEELLKDIEGGAGYMILFLDIEMGRINGLELGLKLREMSYHALLIYVSGYEQYLRQLFECEPFRFLSKPLDSAALARVLEAAFARIEKEKEESFRFQYGRNVISLYCRDILYLESNRRKVIVHSVRGEYEYYEKLDDAAARIMQISNRFVRIHKAFLVNIDHVEAFQYDKLALRDGTILNISEVNRTQVRNRFWDELGKDRDKINE